LGQLIEMFNNQYIVYILSGLVVILVFSVLSVFVRLRRLEKRYRSFMKTAVGDMSLEERLVDFQNETENLRNQFGKANRRLMFLEEKIPQCLQKTAIVRYNAFDDIGSDLSFAVALLNEEGSGVVISSLYGRQESRIYSKPINKGLSSYVLTDEEKQAVEKALKSR